MQYQQILQAWSTIVAFEEGPLARDYGVRGQLLMLPWRCNGLLRDARGEVKAPSRGSVYDVSETLKYIHRKVHPGTSHRASKPQLKQGRQKKRKVWNLCGGVATYDRACRGGTDPRVRTPEVGSDGRPETWAEGRPGFVRCQSPMLAALVFLYVSCNSALGTAARYGPECGQAHAIFTRFGRRAQEPGSSAGPNAGRESVTAHETFPPFRDLRAALALTTREEAKWAERGDERLGSSDSVVRIVLSEYRRSKIL